MKSYNNCFLNVVYFAQIALKTDLFHARPASVHAQS